MSNKSQKISYITTSNQLRGHADYAQASYSQQYGFSQQLSSVPSNPGHDMNKQVAAGQSGMYSTSAGMAAPVQHHQSMGGPVPSPQNTSMVQQMPQINRVANIPNYFARAANRQVPTMRNSLSSVVNQAGQQQPSQYGASPMQMVPPQASFLQMMPQQYHTVMNYQSRGGQQYGAPQYQILTPGSQQQVAYFNYNIQHQSQSNANNGYQYNTMQGYNPVPAQMPQQPIPAQQQPPPQQQQQRRTKALAIVDPVTGKNIFDNNDGSGSHPPPEKETENDSSVGVEFAKQVALTLNISEPSSKPMEDTRIMDSQIMCPSDVGSISGVEESDMSELGDHEDPGELADTESIGDLEYIESHSVHRSKEPAVILYKKDIEPISINETAYDNEMDTSPQVDDSVPAADLTAYDEIVPQQPDIEVQADSVQNIKVSSVPEKSVAPYEIPEVVDSVQSIEPESLKDPIDVGQPVMGPTSITMEESVIPDSSVELLEVAASVLKITDKTSSLDSKKNKAKKKKDYNKRGESKEGGEMDAFLDTKEEDAPISSIPPSVAPVPTNVERTPSPVPIMDSELIASIPLPGESFDNFPPQNDISPSEPTSDTSVSPSAESEDKENVSDDPNKIVLKYSYKEDQWSPLNPEGKKQYDRDFLLQLQGQPMSLCKPNNLPNLDVIKDKAHIQRLTEVNRVVPQMIPQQIRTYNDPFMPNYARGGAPRMPHPAVNRRSQQGRGEKPRKVISFTSSLTQNIKLHESENAWKPLNKLVVTAEMPQDDLEKEKLKRSVQGVLNKLTPQKFETLLTQLKGLNIDTEEKLNVVIDLIFEKAIDEPNFSVPYANLCKHLALIKVPSGDQPGQHVNFRKLLLTKCQKEFEKDRTDELKHAERMKALEEAEPEKQKEMKLEFDMEEKKMRYRQLGNIRFIGELFKLGMLIEPIMHECIKKLLIQGDEESLECLCKLLKTIGKELDDKNAKGREPSPMDMYFNQMQKFVDKRSTSSRVRFMLQDVIDLKRGSWVPRRDENMPKTIDQIHQEAEREAREQQINLQNMSSSNYPKRMPDDRDRRKGGGRSNMGQSEDGWTSSSKSNKGSYSALDPTKLKLTKPDEVESIRLGPGGRGLQSWGRGSSGGTKTPAEDVKTALTNRYSALQEQNLTPSSYDGRRGSQRSAASSRESSRGRSNQLPPAAVRKTSSTSKERESLLETVKGLSRLNETKVQEVKKNVDVHVNGKAADSEELCLKGPEYSEEDMEKKTKPLIDEFLHNNDYEEAIKCVTELASPNTVYMFINTAINQVLERSSRTRGSLGQLLISLLKKKIISFDQYKKGVGSVLEIIDDYALDIPLIWEYMGEILEPMIEGYEFPLTFLKEVLQPCIPSEKAGKLVSAILHCSANTKGTCKLGEFWKESGLQWTDFLGPDSNVNEFIQKYKLEFTVSPKKVKPTQMPIDEIKKNLSSLLGKNETNELIFDWIDANVSGNTESTFIRALVSAVHNSVISASDTTYELDTTKFKSRSPLLTRYIDHNDQLELQALYAIQALMNELGQPNGLLRQIFDILYDDDVIKEETFKAWESSTDPKEAEGKGVAVQSVKSFFTWLRESESGEEADE